MDCKALEVLNCHPYLLTRVVIVHGGAWSWIPLGLLLISHVDLALRSFAEDASQVPWNTKSRR